MVETKGSRDVFRTIQALWALQPTCGGVGSAFGWYGGRIPVNLSPQGGDENDRCTPQQAIGEDVAMIVTASFPGSFADILYKREILRNGSSQPIT